MKTPTYEDFLADPDAVMEQWERAARRERAQAVHQFLIAPLMQMFERAPTFQPRTA